MVYSSPHCQKAWKEVIQSHDNSTIQRFRLNTSDVSLPPYQRPYDSKSHMWECEPNIPHSQPEKSVISIQRHYGPKLSIGKDYNFYLLT